MKGLVKSDSPFKNILIPMSMDMLAKNVSCQDFIYKVCISMTHHKWSFWLNRISKHLGK